MGAIADAFDSAFRDNTQQGVAASGAYNPEKAYIRALGGLIETIMGTVSMGAMVNVLAADKATLDADLAHPEATVALVYADGTAANNDFYIKVGGSGAGSWTQTTVIHDVIAALNSKFVPGKNKFNPAGAQLANSQFSGAGAVQTSGSFNSVVFTDYMPVLPSTSYVSNLADNVRIVWYDAAKAVIGGASYTMNNTTPRASPGNAAYMRVAVPTSTTPNTLQIEIGTASTAFVAYRLVLDLSYLSIPDLVTSLRGIADPVLVASSIMVPAKNKFDAAGTQLANSHFISGGVIQTGSAFADQVVFTDYIPVLPSTTYVTNSVTNITIVWYDAAKAIIGAAYYTLSSGTPRTSPADAAYMRVSLFPAAVVPAALQIEIGSMPSAYEDYRLVLDPARVSLADLLAALKAVDATAYATLSAGKNIFNAAGAQLANSQFSAFGTLQTHVSFTSVVFTDYVPVAPSTSYVSNSAINCTIVWYNSAKAIIGGASYTMNNTTPRTSPADAAYMRVSLFPASIPVATFQIERGGFATFFESCLQSLDNPIARGRVNDALKWANNELAMPANLRLLKGSQNSIYYRAIQRRSVRDLYYTRLLTTGFAAASVGGATLMNRERYARVTPTGPGTTALYASLYDGEFDEIDRKSLSAIVLDPATNPGAFTYLQIGDSFTYTGSFLEKALALLSGVTMVGIQKIMSTPAIHHEGRSGWTMASYFTRVFSVGVGDRNFSPFLQPVDPYKYYGDTATWIDVYSAVPSASVAGLILAGDAKGFNHATGYPSAPNADDVVYDTALSLYKAWDGSAWQTITAGTLNFSFNFAKYLSVWGLTAPSAVGVLLGTNDFGSQEPRAVAGLFTTFKMRLDAMIASVFAGGTTKFNVMLPSSIWGPSDTLEGIRFPRKSEAAMWEARKLLLANYDNREGEGIYICDFGSAIDDLYGFGFQSTEAPFSDYTTYTTPQTMFSNLPHPTRDGYYQGGIRLAATIQALR